MITELMQEEFQPERRSSLVDRNIADNVFFKPIKQPEDENILWSFFLTASVLKK